MTQDEFTIEALQKVPVAEAVLAVLGRVCTEERLGAIFEEHRDRCYESRLKFHVLVHLVMSAVMEHQGSGRQAFRMARESDLLPVTDQAAYGKIARMPIAVSQAIPRQLLGPLEDLFPQSVVTQAPKCFHDYHIYGIDGKKIKQVAKRLAETRSTPGKLLGGKTLVALSIHDGLVVAMNSTLDGEANDGPLVPGLLQQILAHTPEQNIFLLDSQFCDLTTPRRILDSGADFVVRHHPKTHFHPDPGVASSSGVDSRSRPYTEHTGWLGKPGSRSAIRVRQIRVSRPGQSDIVVVTSLLDTKRFSASDVLDLYALRWPIETVFQHVTKEFDLKHLIGSTAEATIFQFSLSLLLYNIMVLIQQHVSNARGLEPSEISLPKIIRETKKQLRSLGVFVPSPRITEAILSRGVDAARLRKLLRACWHSDWRKAPKNHRNPKPDIPKKSGAHTSVYRQIKAFHNSE